MILQYASDLHLEFPENKEFLRKNPIKPGGDILLLAGDIVPLVLIYEHSDFFDYLSDHFNLTYWLPGNHEFYHSDIKDRSGFTNEKIRENILLVNNTSIPIENLNIVFSTLWTTISPHNQFEIQQRLSDFHVIRNGGKLLTAEQYNLINDQCVTFLREEFSKELPGKKIVVTHHVPTYLNYPVKYKRDVLNEAFAMELYDLIQKYQPDYWIFGHHHTNNPDFRIGKSILTTNQLGYVMYREQMGFDTGKFIEV